MARSKTKTDHPWIKAYPDGIDWGAELRPRSLPAIFDEAVERFGPNMCTHFMGRTMTFAEIAELTERFAAGLSRLGVGPGRHVGLVMPNTPYFIIAYYATLKLGATVVNFNPLYAKPEMLHQARDAQCDIMITVDVAEVFDKVRALVDAKVVEKVIVCSFAAMLPVLKSLLFRLFKRAMIARVPRDDAFVWFEDLTRHGKDYLSARIDPERSVAILQYTGGTTGTPKGAMLTHANISANIQQIGMWFWKARPGEEKMLAVLPFFHVFGMTGVMNFSLAQGFAMFLMPRFDLKEALGLIRAEKITILPGVPTLFNALLQAEGIRREDLSSLVYCISGGAALPGDVRRSFEKLAGCSLVEGYGLSETSPVTNVNPFGSGKDGSIGLPVPRTEVQIRSIEVSANVLPVGEKGELCIRGPQVMKGYWNQPEETEGAFVDNFFRTGDVGYMDEDGYVFLIDRLKDIIITSGFNVYPRHIEEAIYDHPAVAETTVIGIPHEHRGEVPKAYVKLRDGESITADALLDFLKEKLSKLEIPAEIEFRDELPKTLIGKLSKKELRERDDRREPTDRATPS